MRSETGSTPSVTEDVIAPCNERQEALLRVSSSQGNSATVGAADMKYQVIGSNRQSGARMVLEFEAESKAAAERKATQSGMSVNRVVDITDGYPAHAQPSPEYSPAKVRRSSKLLPLIAIAVIGFILFILRNSILALIHTALGGH